MIRAIEVGRRWPGSWRRDPLLPAFTPAALASTIGWRVVFPTVAWRGVSAGRWRVVARRRGVALSAGSRRHLSVGLSELSADAVGILLRVG